jgi:hypothetical protein
MLAGYSGTTGNSFTFIIQKEGYIRRIIHHSVIWQRDFSNGDTYAQNTTDEDTEPLAKIASKSPLINDLLMNSTLW